MKTTPIILATAAIAVGAWSLFNPSTQAAQRLLPFQGRLTDASGVAVADGAKVVQFKIYDAPSGGTAVWNGEVQKLTVNGGLVSTLLGSKADLGAVDFNQALYLEITVDANADNQITSADPPLLPRQSILPAVFAVEAQTARDSVKLGGFDWAAFFDNGDPTTGKIAGNRLQPASLPSAIISADDGISAAHIAPSAIGSAELGTSSVLVSKLATEVSEKLMPAGTIVAYGGAKTGAGGSDNVPAGWLLCDGSALKSTRAEHVALFARILKSWGDGTTASTGARSPAIPTGVDQTDFNIPDLRGYFLRGVDDVAGRDPNKAASINAGVDGNRFRARVGGNEGNAVGSVQNDGLFAHSHSLGGDGKGGTYRQDFFFTPQGTNTGFLAPATGTGVFQNNTGSTSPTGGLETRPKNVYVNYLIKL